MPTNATKTGNGSYKDSSGERHEFKLPGIQVYTEDKAGIENIVADIGYNKLAEIFNKTLVVKAVNDERQRLTADIGKERTQKSNAFDEIKNASTPAERDALMKKHGLL
jgi:hypothetical protein